MDLKTNIGKIERIFRGGLGVALMIIALLVSQGFYQEMLLNVLVLVGFVLLMEGALGWCAGYAVLNMESVERKSK